MKRVASISTQLLAPLRAGGVATGSTAQLFSARPPAGPSCSRWLTCSCCRPRHLHSASVSSREAHLRSKIPSLETLQHMPMPHLPLPPPLPWSPDSQPFLRHLQILSLALMSPEPSESWEVYQALHPDIRRAIPDDLFASLISHQLSCMGQERLDHLVELLSLGRSCEMDLSTIGDSTLQDIFIAMTKQMIDGFGNYADRATQRRDCDVLDWLWDSLQPENRAGAKPTTLSVKLRRQWLALTMIRYQEDPLRVHRELEKVIELGSPADISPRKVRAVITMSKSHRVDVHKSAVRLAAWCLARDIDIPAVVIGTELDRLHSSYTRSGQDGLTKTRAVVEALVAELQRGESFDAATRLNDALQSHLKAFRTPLQRAEDTCRDPEATMPQIHRAGQELLGQHDLTAADVEAGVNLCLRAIKFHGVDCEALLRITLRRLLESPSNTSAIVKLAETVVSSRLGDLAPVQPSISPQLTARLLNVLISVLPSTESYLTITKLYTAARGGPSPYMWTETSGSAFHRVFASAVQNGHLYFASRLYADFISDGQIVSKSDLRHFIAKISTTPSASRLVLLDRHLKDFIWLYPDSTEELVITLAQSLCHSSQDAAMAVHLARRIQPNLPVQAIQALVKPLATSSKAANRELAYALLRELPASPESAPSYNIVLSSLAKNIKHAGLPAVLALHHDMTSRGIQSTAETVSAIIPALLKSGELDMALKVFNAAIENNYSPNAPSVGRLMVNLAMADRLQEACAVEVKWRSGLPVDNVVDDGPVYGARLLVDIKDGREVDLSRLRPGRGVSRDGRYVPTMPFYKLLVETQRAQNQPPAAGVTEPAPDSVHECQVHQEATMASETTLARGAQTTQTQGKRAVPPVTCSWRSTGPRDGSWLSDSDDRRDEHVGMGGSMGCVVHG